MNLVLRGLSRNDSALSQPLVGRFDERGGSIGRSDNATMTLPDPERLISRVQANVSFGANTYWLEDIGSANPVVHNGLPLGPGVKVPLKPNDDLRIGGYRLTVEYEQTDGAATILRGRVQTAPRMPAAEPPAPAPAAIPAQVGANPFADLLGPGAASGHRPGASDPFADLLAPSGDSPPPLQPPQAAPRSPPGQATPHGGHARLPDDFDPFADFAPPPAAAQKPAPVAPADPLDLIKDSPSGGASIGDVFGLDPAPARDPMADFLMKPGPPSARGKKEPSLDPLAMFDTPRPAPPPPSAPAIPDQVPEPAGAFQPPAVAQPPKPRPGTRKPPASASATPGKRAATPAAPAGPSVKSAYTADEIWNGFLDGAGVDIPLSRGITPEMMRTVGVLLRASIEGMLQLIAVRAAAKNELRAAVTVIQVRDNNPLKFSPDATVALMQLLQPPGRGFMAGPEAIRDAMVDLQSHQIGTMAGMRAALAGVLERFQPELLEGRLTGQSVLDALLPMNRKAKLWELFLQQYRAIRNDAEDDFHELFGKAFVAAYAEQVERLSQAQEDVPTAPP
ncbi:MAG TPA: type VI secretion system-associated FHA domain protein TagH [Burkholderiaceae bacterium]|nr:type VI secretion system-associated FHA domain protein TagH [Burkholderiaceae bacterium]